MVSTKSHCAHANTAMAVINSRTCTLKVKGEEGMVNCLMYLSKNFYHLIIIIYGISKTSQTGFYIIFMLSYRNKCFGESRQIMALILSDNDDKTFTMLIPKLARNAKKGG